MTTFANALLCRDLSDIHAPGKVALPLPLEGMLYDSGSSMKYFAVLCAGFAISTAALKAQSSPSGVPESHRPPPGMCRIWIDGVPPTHQPAPTDCATAIRKRPMNARVLFGNEAPAGSERHLAPAQPAPSNFTAPSPTPSRDDQARIAQQRDEQERQRAAQQRDEQERQRIEAQRRHDEQEKRAARQNPPAAQHQSQEHSASPPRPNAEKTQRPPHQSSFAHWPR